MFAVHAKVMMMPILQIVVFEIAFNSVFNRQQHVFQPLTLCVPHYALEVIIHSLLGICYHIDTLHKCSPTIQTHPNAWI